MLFFPDLASALEQRITLRQLVKESDLILVAKVEPSLKQKSESDIFAGRGPSPARLRPLSVLKGDADSNIVLVYFNPWIVCPRPPEFKVGTDVLSFLSRQKDSTGFESVGMPHGARSLSSEEITIYRQKVTELMAIEAENDLLKRKSDLSEWWMKCVENPSTHWDGAFDLLDNEKRNQQAWVPSDGAPLTPQQRSRLLKSFLQTDYLLLGDLEIAELLTPWNKSEVVGHLIAYLRIASRPVPPMGTGLQAETDSFPEPWNVYFAISQLVHLTDNRKARTLLKRTRSDNWSFASTRIKNVAKFLPMLEDAARKKGLLEHN